MDIYWDKASIKFRQAFMKEIHNRPREPMARKDKIVWYVLIGYIALLFIMLVYVLVYGRFIYV